MTRYGTQNSMGAGASQEQGVHPSRPESVQDRGIYKIPREHSPINVKNINPSPPAGSRPGTSTRFSSGGTLRSSLRGTASMPTANATIRKVRAAALGKVIVYA